MKLTITVMLLVIAWHAPKHGQCPSGTFQSGNYCAPITNPTTEHKKHERRVCHSMPKVGQCPSGYFQSGDYCKEMNCT